MNDRKTGNLIPSVFGSCLGLGLWGTGDSSGSREAPNHCPVHWPLSRGDHIGVRGGGGDLPTVLLFWPGAFLSIFMECKGVFVLFYFLVFFFFFVKLKKNLHLILELPYLKKKKEGKITKKIIKTKLGLNCSGLLFFVACLTEQHALTVPPGTSITEVLHACHVQSGDQRS